MKASHLSLKKNVMFLRRPIPKPKLHLYIVNEVDGMNMLLRGETHLLIAARNFTEKEKQNLKERNFAPKVCLLHTMAWHLS